MTFVFFIIATILVVVLIIVKWKKRVNDESLNYDKEIELPMYNMDKSIQVQKNIVINDANFELYGDLNKYVITKDNRFEFLVIDGVIVACKDRNTHSDFIYYEKVIKDEPN